MDIEVMADEYGSKKTTAFLQEVVNFTNAINIDTLLEKAYSPYIHSTRKIDKIKSTIIKAFKTEFHNEIDSLFKQAELPKMLTRLKKLEDEHSERKETWRPPGNVDDHCRSLRVQANLKLKNELDSLIKVKMLNIDKLKVKIRAGHEKDSFSQFVNVLADEVNVCSSLAKQNDTVLWKFAEESSLINDGKSIKLIKNDNIVHFA
ncbi:uncharacterized protein LOC106670243 [Cimex lectularius]|uniref:Uncharacterized protein n=1 Tax=Cimex lectularius TaxID=79782 RepID=A0A8I6S2W2_CIMLE|nr:uncharacterized protein LOC106670243 [Cimex lectularius]XP_014255881.1 uncharacterized protein LOC106670243 [Cimex lectularius]